MAKYLVTGGCGFIGSHLVDALHQRGDSVRILDDLSTGTLLYRPSGVDFVQGDVADPATVAEAMRDVDACFHLAAVASVERGHADWLGTNRTNLTGTVAVFDAARHVGHMPIPVVFASSAAVYGDSDMLPLSEDRPPQPISAYGVDKFACELYGSVASRVHGVPTFGLRFFNVYGPRQNPKSPYSGVISIFCDRLASNQPVMIYGDGCQTRDFIYVGDVVRALLSAMDRCSTESRVLNVCTGTPTSILQLLQFLADIAEVTPEVSFRPSRKGDIRSSLGDPSNARRVLNFAPSADLFWGLTRTIDVDQCAAAQSGQPRIKVVASLPT